MQTPRTTALIDGSVAPQWNAGGRFWPSFTGGEFRHPLQEGVIGGTPNPGYVFRFEAEGHLPFITRVYQADEGEARLDVELRPAEQVRVIAYTPWGEVAHGCAGSFCLPTGASGPLPNLDPG
jgi:hypothetical protein